MPFSSRRSFSDVLQVFEPRQRLTHSMPGLIAKFACRNKVIEAVLAAVHSWVQMLCGALEALRQSSGNVMAL
jgi:hypothetical protein